MTAVAPTLPDLLILALGNADRGDDGAGPAVARRLAGRVGPGVEVRCLSGAADELLDAWEGRGDVLVIDASAAAGAAGSVRRFDATRGPLPARMRSLSSHGFGLAEAVELGRALGRLPARLGVVAIEGSAFGPGEGLTPEVEEAVERVADEIVADRSSRAG